LKNIPGRLFLRTMPKILLTRCVGYFANASLPQWILRPLIRMFVKIYKIDMSEYQETYFPTFNHFFTRSLRPECRPMEIDPKAIVSPVDGTIAQFGTIQNGQLIQAKGIDYPLKHLVYLSEYEETFQNGKYITIYLSPRDYHRIHTPATIQIHELLYLPGALYPVNHLAVHNIPSLFTINERIISLLQSENNTKIALIKVGATIVGKIKVIYDIIEANHTKEIVHKTYSEQNLLLLKGDEIGQFQMGSTIILLFPPETIEFHTIQIGQKVKLGQTIAHFNH